MNTKRAILLGGIALTLAGIAAATSSPARAAQAAARIAIDNDDIGGVVRNPAGQPEAGVWVIAETHDLAVRFIKIVVTDDQGRFVVPDLPQANYQIWARGYGLVDSAKITSTPGKLVDIAAVPAPNEAAAAKYYPAIYWYSMMTIPGKDQFGGKNPNIPARLTQQGYLNSMKSNGCVGCHQLGQLATRTVPALFHEEQPDYADMWLRRIQSGQGGVPMIQVGAGDLGGAAFKYLGDWSQRVEKGELPKNKPQRPQGVERNIVITLRDWMNDKQYLHDLISTDRRYPTVNGYGPLYGSPEYSSNDMPILDPVKNTATKFRMTVQADAPLALGPGHVAGLTPLLPSNYWGDEAIWDTRVNNHNSMIGRDGRVWLAATFRKPDNAAFCKAGSDHPSAKVFPINRNVRSITVYDPKTKEYKWVDTCFGTHHLQFGYDANETVWASGGGQVLGWLNTKMYDQTGDAAKSQGWTPFVMDTNGNGKRDAGWVEPNQPVDPTKDKRVSVGFYAVMPNPVDGSIWGSYRGNPGAVVRVEPGSNPSETALTEVFNVPAPGFGVRGADIDSKGVVWVSLASGHLGEFDRRKCKGPLNGPKATGDHCPEGWTLHQYPGPGFEGIGPNSAEASYYSWVDQHNTFGLGDDVPMSTANLNDGLVAYSGGKMVMLRVPYPLGWYGKGFDGRIDDPKAGWKGRGLWMANGDRTPWLIEGGKGTKPLAAHFQLRPDPLAK